MKQTFDYVRLQCSERDLFHNCRIKSYPDGTVEVCCANRQIFRAPGWEGPHRLPSQLPTPEQERMLRQLTADPERQPDILAPEEEALYGAEPPDRAAALERAKRRARSAVRDLGLANDWAYFVTLTLDAQRVDRYDVRQITRKLNQWLDNHVRRDGLAYVLVPEHHKDGAVHFHGFFNGALRAVDSGTVSMPGGKRPRRPRSPAERERWLAAGGHPVFNLPQWTLGFTTAIPLYGDKHAAVGYVCKYITKNREGEKIGGRWYYSGGALRLPEVTLTDANQEDLQAAPGAKDFQVPQLPGIRFTLLTSQAPCDVNHPAEKPPEEISEIRGGFTVSGLSTRSATARAAAAPDSCEARMTPEKDRGEGGTNDHGIPTQ